MKNLFFPLVLALPLALQAQSPDPDLVFDRPQGTRSDAEIHLHAGWESRYVSEGRDNLDGDGLITGTLEIGWEYLSFGAWYADSPDGPYDELQLNAALTKTWGDFEVYVGYTYLGFPNDNTDDNEIGAGVAWGGLPYELVIALDAYYSLDVDGAFIELSCGNEIEINSCLTLFPALVFGVNQGYISDGHDGANHIAANLGAEYAINDALALAAHVAYNFEIDSDPLRAGDDTLRNFFHTGLGLSWTF